LTPESSAECLSLIVYVPSIATFSLHVPEDALIYRAW